MVPVSIPARSSVNVNTRGENVVGIFVDHAGDILVITGSCGLLKENAGVHVWVSLFSFGLSVTEISTYTCFSISYGSGAGKLTKYHLNLFCRDNSLWLVSPVRSRIVTPGLLGLKTYDHAHEQVGQDTVMEMVPLSTPS